MNILVRGLHTFGLPMDVGQWYKNEEYSSMQTLHTSSIGGWWRNHQTLGVLLQDTPILSASIVFV